MKTWKPKGSGFRVGYDPPKVLGGNRGDLMPEAVVLSLVLYVQKRRKSLQKKTHREKSN